jgi:DNA uptake protein ComE-like DNA-binding protein
MMTATQMKEYTYKPSGVKVDLLSTHDDGEYHMVRSQTTGKVFFAYRAQLIESTVEPETPTKSVKQRRGRQIVRSEVPALNRINLNNATPQMLTQILKGVGLKTATEIYELKQSLPGERFTKLDQLRSIKRVDWDEVLADDSIYVE